MQIAIKLVVSAFALQVVIASSSARADCLSVERSQLNNYPGTRVVDSFNIDKPGQYCLRDDIRSRRKFSLAEGGEQGSSGAIGHIAASDVSLDLNGHSISAEGLGEWGVSSGNRQRTLITNVTIRNGEIVSRTNRGLMFDGLLGPIYVSLLSEVRSVMSRPDPQVFDYAVKSDIEPLNKLKGNFPLTGHRLERLTIKSALRGIGIKGGGNAIRDSKITIGEEGPAIYLIGPKQLIENNVIVVPAPKRDAGANNSPIKLHLADGTVIRNNTIIIEGWGDKPDAAISIVDSKNVVIENNKIIGTKSLYKIWDEDPGQKSSVLERGNEFVSELGRRFGW